MTEAFPTGFTSIGSVASKLQNIGAENRIDGQRST